MNSVKKSEAPLAVELKDDQVVITIGIDTLANAFYHGDCNYNGEEDRKRYNVVDPAAFAKTVVAMLEEEDPDDGSTPIHHALDAAFEGIVEANIRFEDDLGLVDFQTGKGYWE